MRIKHCDPEELRSDVVAEYSEEIVRELRAKLAADVKKITKLMLTGSRAYKKFDVDIKKYYQENEVTAR